MEYLKPISFVIIFSICFILEQNIPLFKEQYKKRFIINLGLLFLSIVTVKLVFPWSLNDLLGSQTFTYSISQLPFAIGLVLTIVIFDCAIYWQHRLSHIIPIFWLFHKIHHCDKAMDLSTGFRFHPMEILLSSLYKFSLLLLLRPSFNQYLIYETILFSMAIFNHSNFKISDRLDRFLRIFIVTPSMHYPHHHPSKENTNSNYGNFLSLWDRLFNSYNSNHTNLFGLNFISKMQSESFRYVLYGFLSNIRLKNTKK